MPRYIVFLKDHNPREFYGVVPFIGKSGELEMSIDPTLHRWDKPIPPPAVIYAAGIWRWVELQPEEEVKKSAQHERCHVREV